MKSRRKCVRSMQTGKLLFPWQKSLADITYILSCAECVVHIFFRSYPLRKQVVLLVDAGEIGVKVLLALIL